MKEETTCPYAHLYELFISKTNIKCYNHQNLIGMNSTTEQQQQQYE